MVFFIPGCLGSSTDIVYSYNLPGNRGGHALIPVSRSKSGQLPAGMDILFAEESPGHVMITSLSSTEFVIWNFISSLGSSLSFI